MSAKYGINIRISLRQSKSFFNISKKKQEQAIKNAQESWDTIEVLESLKKTLT